MIKVINIVLVIFCTTTNLAVGFNDWKTLHKAESSGKNQVFHHGSRAHLDKGILVVPEKLYQTMTATIVSGILT